MIKKRKISKYVLEYAIYGMIWILLFAAQILEGINKPHYDSSADSILKSFIFILPFFIFFIVHDFSLSYFEIRKRKRWVYLVITISATIFMMFHHELVSPDFKKHDKFGREKFEKFDHHKFEKCDDHKFDHRRESYKHKPDFGKPPKGPKPFHFFPPIANTLLVLLIIVFNRGLKMQFRYFAKEKRFMELENENIQNELNYLKHQINPHFFMNTLNSIHALIRTNPEKAEDAIVGFSKIMRYLLYESNQQTVSLEKELVLIKNYVALMRLLLTDHVKINLELPWIYPTTHIPPLIFITFLENAFKHGISYSKESFITFTLKYDDHYLYSSIQNSNHHVPSDGDSGIGLENVKKRLFLIFGDRYNIKITNTSSDFRVDLQIPIQL